MGLKLSTDIGIAQEDFFKPLKLATLSLGVLSEASEEKWCKSCLRQFICLSLSRMSFLLPPLTLGGEYQAVSVPKS